MGANGGGKTKLATALIGDGSSYPRGVAFDVKGDLTLKCPHTIIRRPDDWRWKWFARNDGWILYRPLPEFNTGPWLDEALRRLYVRAQRQYDARAKRARRPFIIYVDEGLYLAKTGSVRWLAQIAVATRSMGCGLWVASQRPKWIPVEVRTEAWRWYVFALAFIEDDREVSNYTKGRLTVEMLETETADYEFFEIKRAAKTAGRLTIRHFPKLPEELVA